MEVQFLYALSRDKINLPFGSKAATALHQYLYWILVCSTQPVIWALDLSTEQPSGPLWLKLEFSVSGQPVPGPRGYVALDAGPTQLSLSLIPLPFHTPSTPWALSALLHTLRHALLGRLYPAETGHVPF